MCVLRLSIISSVLNTNLSVESSQDVFTRVVVGASEEIQMIEIVIEHVQL